MISPTFEGAFLPVILGHEGAGIVESVGPGVTNVKPGTLIYDSKSMDMPGYFSSNIPFGSACYT